MKNNCEYIHQGGSLIEIEIEKQIKSLEQQKSIYLEEISEQRKKIAEEKERFFQKIKSTVDVNFMREILTENSIMGTPKYSWIEFYCLCENPNLTDEIIALLLAKEAHGMIVSKLRCNDGLSFLQIKKVLKNQYFRNLQEEYNRRTKG